VLAESAIGAVRSVSLLAHQTPDGSIVLGGSWYPQEEPEPADLTERILARAHRLLPGIARPRVVAERHGVRPVLPDRRPVVDRLAPGLFGCFGHGGEGFIAGPGSAALLADLVTADQDVTAGGNAEGQHLRWGRWPTEPSRRKAPR
jgi:glycine/D-amino acid oxidase-like deaminating enzyme